MTGGALLERRMEVVVGIAWGLFWLYWLVAALSMKRGQSMWRRQVAARTMIAVVVVVLVRLGAFRGHIASTSPWRAVAGLVLVAAGLGFAVWARVHIGRNWGSPMTRRDEPELVVGGPYRLVRHPIYSGLILAGAGTAIVLGWQWLAVAGLAGAYFVASAVVEERDLSEQFPDEYPAYRRSTKMLLPYIF